MQPDIFSSTSSTSSTITHRCSYLDTATDSSPRTYYTKVLWAEKISNRKMKMELVKRNWKTSYMCSYKRMS